VLQGVIFLALFEFYQLASKKELFPQKVIGFLSAFFIGLSFYQEEIQLSLVIFLFLLLISVYYLTYVKNDITLDTFPSSVGVTFFGAFYISFTLSYLILLQKKSPNLILFLLTVIYIGDTGAYFVGKLWGKRKMVPLASPNKTWEGGIGGILFAVLGAIIGQQLFLKEISLLNGILCGVLLNIVAQMSDPVESLFKRAVRMKDSSHILPGHGGMLDRIDSLILSAPFFYYYVYFLWGWRF
ncbi:MAG: phosphatidate cytidylyltransferase, partial [Candidatus Aminicenantia bacterium]